MGIDLEKIRRKLASLDGKNSIRANSWRPDLDQEYTIRLLAYPDTPDGLPMKELWFYYNISDRKNFLAPKQFNKPDPVQELIDELRADGSPEAYAMCKNLYPSIRYYAPVVVRGKEEEGVKMWSFGKTIYKSLLEFMLDEDYGDITCPDKGFDLKVKCTKPAGKQYNETSVRCRPKSTVLTKDKKQLADWVANMPDPDDFYTLESYEVLEKAVSDFVNGPDDSSEGTVKNAELIEPTKPVSTDEKMTEIADAFESLNDL